MIPFTFLSKIPSDLAGRLGWCALHFLWQGAAVGAGLWLMLAFCRRGTAELRHALCGLALLAMAVVPVITWQRLPVPEETPVKVVALPDAVMVGDFPGSAASAALDGLEQDGSATGLSLTGLGRERVPFVEDQRAPILTETPPLTGSVAPAPWWQRGLGMVWLAGAALIGVWRFCGLWGTFRLIRRAERAVDEVLDRVGRMAGRCGLRRVPEVRITGRLISPAVAGVLRPVLLLPAAAMAGLSPRELDFVLAHEFAHIRRQDFLLGLLQSLVEMLLFFHPVVWWVSRRMSFEREQACDDAAMRVTGNRQAGASALARLAELQLQHTAAMAPAAGGGQILARVRRLLDPARPPQPHRAQVLILLPALLAAAAVPLLLMTQRAESQTAAPTAPPQNPETPAPVPAEAASPSPSPAPPPDRLEKDPPKAPFPDASPAAAPDADISAASGQAPPEKVMPILRGSITDRNGVVLAESTLQDLSATGGVGVMEVRRYPLGATASHVLGYVRENDTYSTSGTGRREQDPDYDLRARLATSKVNLEGLSKLNGDQLIEGAMAYGMGDGTLRLFATQWKKDRVDFEMMTHFGYGLKHPKVAGLASSIQKEKEILLEAVENYKASLAVSIRNLEAGLRTASSPGSEHGEPEAVAIETLYHRFMAARRELTASIAKAKENALSQAAQDDPLQKYSAELDAERKEYEQKLQGGFASNHPAIKALARTIELRELRLRQLSEGRQAAAAVGIRIDEQLLQFLEGATRSLKEKLSRRQTVFRGIAGIEKAQDRFLKEATPDADGKPRPAVALALDARIQRISENALRDAHIGRGAAVVLDVANGDVLAMASVPDFDPNSALSGVGNNIWKQLAADPSFPLVNRALSAYPPGSTFKLVTAIAAGSGEKWSRRWNCSGTVTYGGRQFACWTVPQHVAPHGTLGLAEALKNSCNCYFYQCGNATGIDRIEEVAKAFGLGDKQDIGIDYEVSDFMPGQQWWAQKNQGPWTSAKTANVAIGQGEVKATPLEMAAVAAAVATDGKVWRQRVISKSLIDGVWQSPEPRLEHDLAADGAPLEAFAAIREGMWKSVNDEEGSTGKAARSPIVTIAGKTGTAQKWRMVPDADGTTRGGEKIVDNHTWFIGFAPFDKPRYAFAIVVGNGKSGGSVSAPIARRIMESVVLMNEGRLNVDLSPLAEAKGNFDFVESVNYAPVPLGQ